MLPGVTASLTRIVGSVRMGKGQCAPLFAADSNSFTVGTSFSLIVTLADGSVATVPTTIP